MLLRSQFFAGLVDVLQMTITGRMESVQLKSDHVAEIYSGHRDERIFRKSPTLRGVNRLSEVGTSHSLSCGDPL